MNNIEKFRELLLSDEEFQKKLQDAAASYTGDQSEEAAFNNILVPLAAEYGITATFDEFKAYISELDGEEMSKGELQQISGGKVNGGGAGMIACDGTGLGIGFAGTTEGGGFCIGIGGGNAGTICLTAGAGWGT